MDTLGNIPVERRRTRHHSLQSTAADVPLRRESDQVKARLLRWIDLADRALGKPSSNNGHSASTQSTREPKNKE